MTGPSCILMIFLILVFLPLPFFTKHFSKSRFSYGQLNSGTKTSVSSGCIKHVIPDRVPRMKNHMHERISLLVTELYFRNRISLWGCVKSPALVFGFHMHMIRLTTESASQDASVFSCNKMNLTISAYLWWHWAYSLFHDSPYRRQGVNFVIILYIVIACSRRQEHCRR